MDIELPGDIPEKKKQRISTSKRIIHGMDSKIIKQRSEHLRHMMEEEGTQED